MTDTLFEQAQELKNKIRQIDSALQRQPAIRPYVLNQQLPNDQPFIQQLAAPGLDEANSQWDLLLRNTREELQREFEELGQPEA